jgi:thiol:disulfide interchange protein
MILMIDIAGEEKLNDFIIESSNYNKIIMLYFGAEWCGPCKQLKNKLCDSEIIKEIPNIAIAHLDVDKEENADFVKCYNVSSLPTQIFISLKNNKVVEKSRIIGYDYTKLKLEYDEIVSKKIDF